MAGPRISQLLQHLHTTRRYRKKYILELLRDLKLKDGQERKRRHDILALLRTHPDAADQKTKIGLTPLHVACHSNAAFEVVTALLKAWPQAVQEKDIHGRRPLHVACRRNAPFEVVSALLEAWPHAGNEKDMHGRTPLHDACRVKAPFKVVAALLEACPQAVKEKGIHGWTPLHDACRIKAPFKVRELLLKTWLSYEENRTKSEIMSLQRYNFKCTGFVLFSHLFALYNNKAYNHTPREIMNYFIRIQMWNGVTLVLDTHPTVIKTMDLDMKVTADVLSMTGRRCNLLSLWRVLCNEQDLLAAV